MTSALHRLWKSALIVEQGVAPPAPHAIKDEHEQQSLERLMGIARPAMNQQELTTANLQQQMSGERSKTGTEAFLVAHRRHVATRVATQTVL
jgi:hypothetical protein